MAWEFGIKRLWHLRFLNVNFHHLAFTLTWGFNRRSISGIHWLEFDTHLSILRPANNLANLNSVVFGVRP